MDELPGSFFAPPAFNPEEALVQLQRQLRDLRPLVVRGNCFELQGKAVIELALGPSSIAARLARQPRAAPEWDSATLDSGASMRKWLDEVRKRLARWTDEER